MSRLIAISGTDAGEVLPAGLSLPTERQGAISSVDELITAAVLAYVGWWLYGAGKRYGSRRGYGAGFRRGRRRRRR